MSDRNVSARKLRQERTLLVLTLTVFALSAIISGLYSFRVDLTSDRSFTLSPATRELYRQIPETATITYYVSSSLAARHPGPKSVEDLLREIEARSRGRIRVRVLDPSENPGKVEALGIYPLQMQVEERGEARIATVYAGIVVEYLDDFRALPAVMSTENLEYEIVKAVRSLARGTVPVAALLEGDGDKDPEGDYRILKAALARAGYETRFTARGAAIDPDVSVLFVLGNAVLDEYDACFIDRYLGAGGRVLAAARGVRVDPDRGLYAEALGPNAFLDLLGGYGVEIGRELVLDASSLTVPFQTQGPGGGVSYRYVRYPHWVVIDRKNVSESHLAASNFSGLDLYWPSPIGLSRREGLQYEPLVKSSDKAWRQTKYFAAAPEDEALYRDEEEATRGQYLLGVAVSGIFPPAFQDRAVPRRQGDAGDLPAMIPEDRRRPGRLLVVSSSDFLTDLMSMSRSEFNASFAARAADWLTSEDDLPLPAGARETPRLRSPDDPSERSFQIGLVYILNIAFVPALVAGFALFASARRRRAERAARSAGGRAAKEPGT